jgi:DNA-binding transcriptional MerR regulator/quercetin dioxygenase-like cupin family protein
MSQSDGSSALRAHRIGEAARLVGVSPSALRLWERQGLVRPKRSGRRYRLYSAADLDRLRRIQAMRTLERVNAPGIRRILDERAEPASAALPPVGARLRQMRLARRLTLREAAAGAGLSGGHLGAIERGEANPSVASLQRLTHAYGATIQDLLHAPQHASGGPVRSGERGVTHVGDGVRIEQLARDATMLEPQLFVLAPGARSEGVYAHAGEEFLFVLSGRLMIWVDDEPHDLGPGDAHTFASTLPHRWRNDASGETRLLWINTPPTF